MIRHWQLQHRFVEYIPESLEVGVLYISMSYATAAHSCCCGCGEEVVTPFTPTDWRMTFDGETISLYPSIGNWMLRCRSHYVINHGAVIEAEPWSAQKIEAANHRNRVAKADFYKDSSRDNGASPESRAPIWRRVLRRVIGKN